MKAVSHHCLTALSVLLIASPATAQNTVEDWEYQESPGVSIASVTFDNGVAVVVRCQNEALETYIGGLAPLEESDTSVRMIDYAFGDAPLRQSSWQTSKSRAALFADLPAPLARRWRAGGDLQLRLTTPGAPAARRYVMSLPPSPAAIDRVLAACGRPAIDARDALRRDELSTDASEQDAEGLRWARIPQLTYPPRALTAGLSGIVVLSCLAGDRGRLEDCQVEAERPGGADFGREAVRAAERARLEPVAGSGIGRLVAFTIRFNTP